MEHRGEGGERRGRVLLDGGGGGGCEFLSEGVRGAVGFQGGCRVVAIGVCRWQAGYQATGNKGAWIANGGPQYTPSSNTACFPCLRARQKELLL